MAYTKYSLTPANNTATPPDGAPEGMLPSAVNDTMRDMMAQIRDCGDGIRDGTYTMTAPKITGGTITGAAFTGNTFTSPVISGGSINNTPIGASTANTGAFTTLSASGVATISAGTVSAPALTTTGDTNTGIFFPAADTIAFTEGGAEAMRIDSSGNVGIGNTPTYSRLDVVDVKAGANFSGLTVWNNTTNATGVSSTINLPVFNGAAGGVIQEIGNSVDGYRLNIYQDQGSGVITFGTGGNNERMRITSTGNVGIGTSTITSGAGWTPTLVLSATSAALVVKGINSQENSFGTSNGLFIDCLGNSTGTNNNIIFRNTSTNSSFSSTERMRITSAGDVGIGTSSPADVLQVSKSANTANGIRITNANSGTSTYASIYFGGATSTTDSIIAGLGDSTTTYGGARSMVLGTNTSTPVVLITGGTEKMRLDSSGNIGLGVTPSAWGSTSGKAIQFGGGRTGALWNNTLTTGETSLTNNCYWNGTNWIYVVTAPSSIYSLNGSAGNGTHAWYTAASGTAGNAITFTQAMTLDASGNLAIGTSSPAGKLSVYGDSVDAVSGYIENNNAAGSVAADKRLSFAMGGSSAFGISGWQNAGVVEGTSTGGLWLGAYNGAIKFATGSSTRTERMRITSSGDVLVGTTTVSGKTSVKQTAASNVLYLDNSNATTVYGMQIAYTSRTPNAAGEEFIYCGDATAVRMTVRSNGGIANYSANNVNLSDEREKTNIQLAGSYLDKICAIPVKTFNYIDQNRETDDGLTLGVIAQDVEKVAPELVMESDWGTKEEPKMRLSIYQTDLQYALMKCIQEQQAMIEELKQEVALLKSK